MSNLVLKIGDVGYLSGEWDDTEFIFLNEIYRLQYNSDVDVIRVEYA